MLFPVIKSHFTGSSMEIFLHSGMRGMLASVFLLGTVSSCLFTFLTWVLVEVISVVELTSNLTLETISAVFLEWFLHHAQCPWVARIVRYYSTATSGICFEIYRLWVSYVALQKVKFGWGGGSARQDQCMKTSREGWFFCVFRSHHHEWKWMSQWDSQLYHRYLSIAFCVPGKRYRVIKKTDIYLGRL